MPSDWKTWTELVRARAAARPKRPAYTFLADGEVATRSLTYGELDVKARAIAAHLAELGAVGQRALLLYPSGLDFITAFLGCLYAGVVAVPAYPPRRRRIQDRLLAIVADCRPAVVLTTAALRERADSMIAGSPLLAAARWIDTDALDDGAADAWTLPDTDADSLAFLQYTSGSTGSPKGVMVSHRNLLHNETMIGTAFGLDSESVVVGWLPLYHDMGLIGTVLQPLYLGSSCVIMSPMSFLQKPRRWLDAISRWRAATSGGPNFAYDLCVQRIPPEERAELDLSSWRAAFNGAEPVRAATLERFAEAFAVSGFRREAFYPCYGLAEATLFVTGRTAKEPPRIQSYETAQLEQGRIVRCEQGSRLVACGRTWSDQEVAIVDPATESRAEDGRIGEIWIRGASVASGYFEMPEASERDFGARLEGGGPYLRTGDLGFLDGDELFVTGRLKELIILRGRNLYPHDLEAAAETAHPALRLGSSAAFSIDEDGEERLVLVLEIDRRAQRSLDPDGLEAIFSAIRRAISDAFEAQVDAVVLIRAGTLPKTSSGKIRRRATREAWLAGELETLGESRRGEAREEASADPEWDEPGLELSREELLALPEDQRRHLVLSHLQGAAASALRLSVDRLPTDRPLSGLGLDSLDAMEMRGRLESELGYAPDVVSFLEGASLDQLCDETLEGLDGEPVVDLVPTGASPEDRQPLSHGQEALWFLHRLAPKSTAYTIAAAARLRGELDLDAFERTLDHLARRHPVLRTRFSTDGDDLVQEALPDTVIGLTVESAEGWDDELWQARLEAEARRPFDLGEPPLARILLLRRGDADHLLLLTVHHIVADFWSLAVLLDELGRIYSAQTQGRSPELETGDLEYVDWVRWHRDRLAGDEGSRLENYWLSQLAGELPPLDLPTDRPRPPVQTFDGATRQLSMDSAASRRLSEHAARSGVTLYTALLAAYQTLLYRLSGQHDVRVGSPTAGRSRPELDGVLGYFVNPLVMRRQLAADETWSHHLEHTHRTVLAAFQHQDYPFDLLVQRLQPERSASHTPVFQVLFTLQQVPRLRSAGLHAFALGRAGARLALGGLEWQSLELESQSAQFELALAAAEHHGEIALAMTYNRDLFEPTTVDRLLGHLRQLIDGAVQQPELALHDLPILSATEHSQMLVEWNATRQPFSQHLCLHELIEAQARRTPEAVALEHEGEGLRYGDLIERAEILAGRLRRLGVAPDLPVGLCVERSVDMVVGLLGILKAGGAYVPLDPAYPKERLSYMLEDALEGCSPRLLVSQRALRDTTADLAAVVDRTVELDAEPPGEVPVGPSGPPTPSNLAYVIYTSGSTGRPKGVQIPHRAVVNFIEAMAREPGMSSDDVVLAVTTLAFDIAVLEIFLPLSVGARVVVASRAAATDGGRLAREIEARDVTVMQATPATWRLLLESGWAGRDGLRMLCGGEALPSELADRLRPCGAALWNMYGPTETTVWSAVRPLEPAENPVRVGGVIANTRLHVLGPRRALLPPGMPGEVWIGGDGLARGYHRRPALTAERFVPDPLATAGDPPGERLYRVGDLARRRADSELEILGRTDHQVKVRGYRIELGEIEAALAGHPGVERTVVVVNDSDPADPRLVAWVVPRDEAPAAALREHLRHGLPDYMVPSAFHFRDDLPQTDNGKIDRSALIREAAAGTQAAGGGSRTGARLPRTSIERQLAELWCEILGVDGVGLDDNFFDLGGHSLLLTRLHRHIVELTGRDDLTVVDLFQYPTVGALARFLTPDQEAPKPSGAAATPASFVRHDVAIIGLAGRFPGAANVADFWRNLRDGVESISFFSPEQLREQVAEELIADPAYVPAQGLLTGAENFDAAFFDFTPLEAEVMDPQHRLFLECAWESLEDAGYDPTRYGGRIGLYAGVGMNSYLLHVGVERMAQAAGSYQAFIANDKDFVPTRVSYKLGLRGPSVNVQTACSSSLVATHLACQSLWAGEADMVLAGGVTVRVPQSRGYLHEPGGILSPDGHCRAFDAEARGTVLGNGLGLVVLKPLERALAEGDRVLAVIKGSAINNDGSQKIGYTAPSVEGQAEVVQTALEAAGVAPDTISYVETHGTGTELGDPIEVTALARAFQAAGSTANGGGPSCALGSVKTNIGHLDTAAGVAGLIKTVQALRHRQLPPSLHFERPNPRIPFAGSPFSVNSELREWPEGDTPRRAGVSSFGIGGTNSHLVLEEAPQTPPSSPSRQWQLLLLSARTATALDDATDRLADRLQDEGGEDFGDVAYTLQVGRKRFEHRRWLVAETCESAASALASRDPEVLRGGVAASRAGAAVKPSSASNRRLVFLFSGQGSQHVDMGRALYETEPVFRAEVDRCAELLADELGRDLRSLLYPDLHGGDPAEAERLLGETRFTQPALFAVELALARLWESWGVRPAAMVGHSIGEIVAAVQAGVFRWQDAARWVAERGRRMGEQPGGVMLAVGLPEDALAALLGPELQLAAVNGPNDCVAAGPAAAIEDLERRLASRDPETRHQRLHTSHAFHSAMMRPAVEPLVRRLEGVELSAPRIPFVSNVTGTWITDAEATDPGYWGRHLAEAVRFADAVATLCEEPGVFVEVGPGHALTTLARPVARDQVLVSSLPHPKSRDRAEPHLLETLGRLWQAGVEIDWQALYSGRDEHRQRIELPTYPFESQRFWIEAQAQAPAQIPAADPLRKRDDVGDWIYAPAWRPALLEADLDQAQGVQGSWVLITSDRELASRLSDRLAGPGRRVRWIFPDAELSGLVPLAERLDSTGDGPVRVALLTRGAFRVDPRDTVDPHEALLWGLAPTLSQEHSHLDVRRIDVCDVDGELDDDLLDDLTAELLAPPSSREVAYRSGARYRRVFEPLRLPSHGGHGKRVASAGPWLVTGGLGGVGRVLAKALAESARGARIVLLARTAASPEPAVAELEALGAEVEIVLADVADRKALDSALAAARERFGPLRGVIHAAGVAGGGRLETRQPQAAAGVLRPKVAGTRNLLDALAGDPLDFTLFCSSINAVAGGYGQGDYAAANAFLDAVADSADSRRDPLVVSLGWDRWSGVGMSADSPLGATHPLLGVPVVRTAERLIYRAILAPETHWVLAEHEIAGRPTVPGATFLEMARAAWAACSEGAVPEIRETAFLTPLAVDAGHRQEVLTVLDLEDGEARFQILSRPVDAASGDWQEHCLGRVADASEGPRPTYDLGELRDRLPERLTASVANERSSRNFLVTGRRWQGLREIRQNDAKLLAEVVLDDEVAADLDSLPLHPALLDIAVGCVQLIEDGDYLPLSYERLILHAPLPARLFSYLKVRGRGDALTCDAVLLDDRGTACAVVEGFSMRRVAGDALSALDRPAPATAAASTAAATVAHVRPEDAVLEGTIEPHEAAEIVLRVLARRALPPHLVVSPRDLTALREAYDRFDPARLVPDLTPRSRESQNRPELGTAYVAPEEGLQNVIAEVWQRYLGISQVGAHDNFFELGGTSLLGVQVVGELKKRLGREIATVSLFEAPTISALAKHLEPSADAEPAFASTRTRVGKKKAALGKRRRRPGRTDRARGRS